MSTGAKIKQLRKQKGYTLEELGELVGVQPSAVSKWERGAVKNIKASIFSRLCEVLGTTPNELMEMDNLPIDELEFLYSILDDEKKAQLISYARFLANRR